MLLQDFRAQRPTEHVSELDAERPCSPSQVDHLHLPPTITENTAVPPEFFPEGSPSDVESSGSARRNSDEDVPSHPFHSLLDRMEKPRARSEGTTSPVGERLKQSFSKMRTKVATAFHSVAQD